MNTLTPLALLPNVGLLAAIAASARSRSRLVVAALSLFLMPGVEAQPVATTLHPPQLVDSKAFGVGDGEQAGYTKPGTGGQLHAALWRGTPDSWVDLHPAGNVGSSQCLATAGGQQVGTVFALGVIRATMWSGSADSRVELHPAGALISIAYGVEGGVQAGYYAVSYLPDVNIRAARACIWSGSAGSLIDLHPAFAQWSIIYATSGGQHVGAVQTVAHGPAQACLWTGGAGTCVVLVPAGSRESVALCVGDGQQGGYQIKDASGRGYARLWNGTADSVIDLNPSWAEGSRVLGVSGGVQVGWAYVGAGYDQRACLWRGSAESCVILPGGVGMNPAQATGISRIGDTAYISGWAYVQEHAEAVMWAYEIPPLMLSDFNGDGFVDFFDYDAFVACFEGSACPAGKTADFNGDGFVDFADYADFVTAFEAGV